MAQPTALNYKDTLNKMANLEELSKFVVNSNAALEGKRGQMVKLLADMQTQVGKVRDQIDNIKSQGTTATTEMKQLIKDADAKQTDSLKSIKASISSMLQMDKLETAVKNLEGDIKSLASVTNAATGQNAAAPAFVPGAGPAQPATANAAKKNNAEGSMFKDVEGEMKGGYTYGKRTKGTRKRRGKKSRRKGSKKRKH